MENREMQEEMFRAMFRLKQLNMGGMLKEISVGEYKILEMCSGCPSAAPGKTVSMFPEWQPK